MDKALLIKEIPTALEFDIKPDCRKFWDEAIECVCRNKKISKCRHSRHGRLILIAEDGTEDGCSVNDLRNPILRKVADLKKAAGISAEGVPHETIEPAQSEKVVPQSDEAYWRKFRHALEANQGGSYGTNGYNLFIEKLETWDSIAADLQTQLTQNTYFEVKYHYKTVAAFAEAVKAVILAEKPKFENNTAEKEINKAIKNLAVYVKLSW